MFRPVGRCFRGYTEKKPPAVRRGLLLVQRGFLPTGLEAGSATRAVSRAAAKDVTGGDKLDPKRTVALVVRGGVGLAQRIQAVLRRTRGCGGESRQLEHHPRTGIQFRHAEGQERPFGGYLVLAARSYVGCTSDREFLAVAAENGYRLRRRVSETTKPCTNNDASAATSGSCGSGTGRTAATGRFATPPTTCATTATTARGSGANIHPPDIALTHRSVPGGLHFAAFVA